MTPEETDDAAMLPRGRELLLETRIQGDGALNRPLR